MLDRIAQIALTILGALLLGLLVVGLSVSCRRTSADPEPPTPTPFIDFATTTPISSPYPGPGGTATLIPGGTVPPGATVDSGATTVPGATPVPGSTVDPGATTTPGTTSVPGATAVPGATTVPGATSQPVPTLPSSPGSGWVPGTTVQHVVSRGEWLLQIARCYGTSYEGIRAANWLPYPDYILPGAIIKVPNIGTQGAIVGPPCVVAYTVTAVDTWQSIAQRTGTTTAILQKANPGSLLVGRSIWVPRIP